MKITVTDEDIKNGLRSNPFDCPIALAIHRALGPNAERVGVALGLVAVKPYQHSQKLPEKAEQFVKDFDLGKDVKPLKFTIDLKKVPRRKK